MHKLRTEPRAYEYKLLPIQEAMQQPESESNERLTLGQLFVCALLEIIEANAPMIPGYKPIQERDISSNS